jgi:transposase
MIRLTDEQWERIRKHFPEEHIPDGRPGRKPIPSRRVLEAVLWILNTGAHDMHSAKLSELQNGT